MFVDASALVAMMTDETDAAALAGRLAANGGKPITSPIAVFETAAAVARVLALDVDIAQDAVARFLDLMGINVLSIPASAGPIALDAFARYGKGRGHPAQLNMGDCFAYACARYYRSPLLFKGDDFGHTDIVIA
ncbi:MAG: type II toxin-antitoxin system VapC family toxin [Inquilinus sp.]|uniref:type II toxin-antitoxin system VapC family toxin n=1 Tax=Inquilinus sp. TaxID=1932117 RepID=UPI003F3415E3